MTKENLKSEFHKLIDNIEDENLLENFYEAISDYCKPKSIDIIDELTEIQKTRLISSISQISEGDTVDNETMKDEIRKWLTK